MATGSRATVAVDAAAGTDRLPLAGVCPGSSRGQACLHAGLSTSLLHGSLPHCPGSRLTGDSRLGSLQRLRFLDPLFWHASDFLCHFIPLLWEVCVSAAGICLSSSFVSTAATNLFNVPAASMTSVSKFPDACLLKMAPLPSWPPAPVYSTSSLSWALTRSGSLSSRGHARVRCPAPLSAPRACHPFPGPRASLLCSQVPFRTSHVPTSRAPLSVCTLSTRWQTRASWSPPAAPRPAVLQPFSLECFPPVPEPGRAVLAPSSVSSRGLWAHWPQPLLDSELRGRHFCPFSLVRKRVETRPCPHHH